MEPQYRPPYAIEIYMAIAFSSGVWRVVNKTKITDW
jgi:hypothetical protein